MARKRKEVEPEAPVTDEVVEADAAPEAQPEELEVVAPGSVEEQESVPAAPPVKWLVMQEARVSLFGQITTLPEGSFVSVTSYGEEGIRRIMRQGVLLMPVG